MKTVSIIVPIYNAERYLEECIDTLINQTYSNIEIILVNDGSVDNSLKICKTYEVLDKRIVVIDKPNTGVSDTRNRGIDAAKGDYLAFVDADDTLDITFIGKMVKGIEATGTDAVFCNFSYNYDGKLIKKKPRLKQGIYNIQDILPIIIDDGTLSGILFGSICAALYKKSIIDKKLIRLHKSIKHNEDGIFNIEYVINSDRIYVLNDYLYYYRQTQNSASTKFTSISKTFDATKKIEELMTSKYHISNLYEQLSARHVSEVFWLILTLCSKNNKSSYKSIINTLRDLLNDKKLQKDYTYINREKINVYKRIYYILMKYKLYRTIFITTRYLYPFLCKRVKR